MRISEIFHSIQGEGVNAGKESVFVRFFGCNLSCSWCDTKYSWHPKFAEFTEMSLEEVVEKVREFDCSHVIFTGGEPALFQTDIFEIISALGTGHTFEIESNGTIELSAIDAHLGTVNISPKLSNSGNKSEIKALDDRYYYKFVIVNDTDIDEVLELQKQYNLKNILLMAEGNRCEVQEEREPYIRKLCKEHGFQYSPRLHVLKWNGEKGK